MLMREESRVVEIDSICFILMYRCSACGELIRGKLGETGTNCERCDEPLDENDEIALRLEE